MSKLDELERTWKDLRWLRDSNGTIGCGEDYIRREAALEDLNIIFPKLIAVARAAKAFSDAPAKNESLWYSWTTEEGIKFREMLTALEALEKK